MWKKENFLLLRKRAIVFDTPPSQLFLKMWMYGNDPRDEGTMVINIETLETQGEERFAETAQNISLYFPAGAHIVDT